MTSSARYGMLAVFQSKETFLKALNTLKLEKIDHDCFSSFEVDEIVEAKDSVYLKINVVKVAALSGAAAGLCTAIFMQWYATVISAPWNVGGKPIASWVAYIPISFVLTVLFTGLSLYITLFFKLKLPQPYHPVFNAKNFDLSQGNFSILILETPHLIPPLNTRAILETLHADSLEDVSW
jgi:hypothetical protein